MTITCNTQIFVQCWTGKNPRRGKLEVREFYCFWKRTILRDSKHQLCPYLFSPSALEEDLIASAVGDVRLYGVAVHWKSHRTLSLISYKFLLHSFRYLTQHQSTVRNFLHTMYRPQVYPRCTPEALFMELSTDNSLSAC